MSAQTDGKRKSGKIKKLQILGAGYPKCKKLAEKVEIAAKELGIEHEIE